MKKLLLIISYHIVLFNSQELTSQNQSAINSRGNYSSVYDFMNQYFNNPVYQPSNNEGGTDEYIKKTYKLWGKSLHPSGDFSVAASAITNYANNYSFQSSTHNPNWVELGPTEDPYGSQSGVGQIHRLAYDPNYDGVSNQTIYAGTGYGGLWKTVDNGLNWASMNTDVQLPIASVSGIAINPNNTNNIFISTGDGDGGFGLRFSNNHGFPNPVATVGVYRTTNNGQTWESINNGLLSNFALSGNIREMKMHPSNPNEIILASSAGIIKTSNATSTTPNWTVEFTGVGATVDQQFRGIAYKPGDPSTIYASGTDIYKFDGTNWSSMTGVGTGLDFNNMPNSFTPVRINIAVTPADPNMLYAYIFGTETSNTKKVFVYVFKNNSWTKIYEAYGSGFTNIAFNWLPIAVSPVNANEYYFGFTKVFGTSDYTAIQERDVSDYTTHGFHADVHALEFTPNMTSPDLFAGTHGGVNYLPTPSDPNPINRWERRYKGIGAALIWAFDNSEFDERKIIGKQDLGISIFKPTTSNWHTIKGGDGYATRIDDESPDEVYFRGNFDFQKYNFFSGNIYPAELNFLPTDFFEQNTTNVTQNFPMVNHPQTGELWFGFSELYQRIKRDFVSGDQNTSIWQVESGNHAIPNHSAKWRRGISELVIAESNSNYIYLATIGVDGGGEGFNLNPLLLRSTIGGSNGNPTGTNFTNITTNLPNIYGGATDYPVITGIAVNPSDENEVWVTFAGYDPTLKVWHSTDAGNTWTNFDPNGSLPNLSTNVIVYQDGTDDVLYLGTDVGVYIKNGNTNDWEKYGDFPNVRVTEMQINYCAGKLDVATYGRGMWEGDIMPYSGYSSPGKLVTISQSFNNIYIKKNLTISAGTNVIINNEINVVPKTKISIGQYGDLSFNGNKINYCNESCSDLYFNVEGFLTVNNGLNLHEKSTINIDSTGTVNINGNNGLCINPNTSINITTGGQLYINGQDYTNILTNGYNNVYDKFFTNQPISGGTYYALNKIETSSSVNTLPGQTTELIAGRQIVFNPGFSGFDGLHAFIDENINNCEETPCVSQGSNLRVGKSIPSNNSNAASTDNNKKITSPSKQENTNLYQIKIFPNPNSGVFTLNITATNKDLKPLKNNEQFNVTVINSMGKKVFERQIKTLHNNLDIPNLAKGLYHINVVAINSNTKIAEAMIIR